jgi:hypothetical protein
LTRCFFYTDPGQQRWQRTIQKINHLIPAGGETNNPKALSTVAKVPGTLMKRHGLMTTPTTIMSGPRVISIQRSASDDRPIPAATEFDTNSHKIESRRILAKQRNN